MIINEGGGGKKLPTLMNPGTAFDMASGKQLINAEGEIVTGSVQTYDENHMSSFNTTRVGAGSSGTEGAMVDKIFMEYKVPDSLYNTVLFRPGSTIGLQADRSLFGNATAADVVAGKTFTSVAGLSVQGTAVFNEIYQTDVLSDGQSGSGFNNLNVPVPNNLVKRPIMFSVFLRDSIGFFEEGLDVMTMVGNKVFYSGRNHRGIWDVGTDFLIPYGDNKKPSLDLNYYMSTLDFYLPPTFISGTPMFEGASWYSVFFAF